MRIPGKHLDPKGKSKKKKSPSELKRKAFSKLKKDFFKQVKKICRERDECIMKDEGFGMCSSGWIQASHIKAEGAWPNLRYDPNNIFPMCYTHHLKIWHKDITECSEWFKRTYPVEWIYLNIAKDHQHIDFNDPRIIELLFAAANVGYDAYNRAYREFSPPSLAIRTTRGRIAI